MRDQQQAATLARVHAPSPLSSASWQRAYELPGAAREVPAAKLRPPAHGSEPGPGLALRPRNDGGRATGREDGQILPGLVMLMLAILALGIVGFQIGKAAILRSQAQTAADAAALAGAREIKRQLEPSGRRTGRPTSSAIDDDAGARADGGVRRAQRRAARSRAPAEDRRRGRPRLGRHRRASSARTRRTRQGTPGPGARSRSDRLRACSAGAARSAGAGAAVGRLPGRRREDHRARSGTRSQEKIGKPPLDLPRRRGHARPVPQVAGLLRLARTTTRSSAATPATTASRYSWHLKCGDMGAIDVNFGARRWARRDRRARPDHGAAARSSASSRSGARGPLRPHAHRLRRRRRGSGGAAAASPARSRTCCSTCASSTGTRSSRRRPRLRQLPAAGNFGGPPDPKIVRADLQLSRAARPERSGWRRSRRRSSSPACTTCNYGDADSTASSSSSGRRVGHATSRRWIPVATRRKFISRTARGHGRGPDARASSPQDVQRPREDLRWRYDQRRGPGARADREHC